MGWEACNYVFSPVGGTNHIYAKSITNGNSGNVNAVGDWFSIALRTKCATFI